LWQRGHDSLGAIWANVADDLERLANPATLAVAAGCLAAFEIALIGEGVDVRSVAIYSATVRDALAWASWEVRLAAQSLGLNPVYYVTFAIAISVRITWVEITATSLFRCRKEWQGRIGPEDNL